jgi:long-chain fatty acid transport protein
MSGSLALRAGFYHDPTPSPDTTINVLLPSYTYSAVAFGVGYKVAGLQLDFGLEYLMGKERNVDYIKTVTDPAFESAMPGTYRMHLVVPNVSVGFRF